MRYEVIADGERRCLEVCCHGPFDAESVPAIVAELERHPAYPQALGILWDVRDADLSVYRIEDMERAWVRRSGVRPHGWKLRIAMVSTAPMDRFIMRLWQTGAGASERVERQSFHDIDAARRWTAGTGEADA